MKPVCILSLCLLLVALPGCQQQTAEALIYDAVDEATAIPTPEPTVTVAPTPQMVSVTLAPTPTPSPTPTFTPTPSPTPSPTPTPTSVPMARRDFEQEVRQVLFPLWAGEPEPTPTVEPRATPDVRAEAIGKLCGMVFANVPILEQPKETANVLARESYHLLYVHNIKKDYYYVTTQEGNQGYVKASQVTPLTEADVEGYLSASMQLSYTAAKYSPDAFVDQLLLVEHQGEMEERIYATLCRLGLDFEPYYYRGYHKDLQNEKKYPLYYKDEVYNTLRYKLFNSTGSLVYYEGHRTQWEYVPMGAPLEKGDILFFSELPKRSTGVLPECEFVVAGPHSGNITDCAVYLGDDSILTLVNGRVERMEGFAASDLFQSYDSARRIHLDVYDDKQLIIEDMIAQVYDCLGTPYNSYARTGDFSFDCSGLISWLLGRMELYPRRYVYYHWTESSASGLSNIQEYLWKGQKNVDMIVPMPMEKGDELKSIDVFERGDIIFLLKGKGGSIGHVMIYLGEGRVIHSTYITSRYSGTVVANFRRALQKLYYTSLRIDSIT